MTRILPLLLTVAIAGYALAGGSAAADLAQTDSAGNFERIAGIALAVLLVLGLARNRRKR